MSHFNTIKEKIRTFPGCSRLELLSDISDPGGLVTYSHWKDNEALEDYLNSGFFRETWKKVKPMFSEKAMAWSLEVISH